MNDMKYINGPSPKSDVSESKIQWYKKVKKDIGNTNSAKLNKIHFIILLKLALFLKF